MATNDTDGVGHSGQNYTIHQQLRIGSGADYSQYMNWVLTFQQQTLESAVKRELAAQKTAYESRLDDLRKLNWDCKKEHTENVASLKEDHKEQLAVLNQIYEKEKASLKEEHKTQMTALVGRYRSQCEEESRKHKLASEAKAVEKDINILSLKAQLEQYESAMALLQNKYELSQHQYELSKKEVEELMARLAEYKPGAAAETPPQEPRNKKARTGMSKWCDWNDRCNAEGESGDELYYKEGSIISKMSVKEGCVVQFALEDTGLHPAEIISVDEDSNTVLVAWIVTGSEGDDLRYKYLSSDREHMPMCAIQQRLSMKDVQKLLGQNPKRLNGEDKSDSMPGDHHISVWN